MKNSPKVVAVLFLTLCFSLVCLGFVSFVEASPNPQDKSAEKSELEALILKRIEEKKKEQAAKQLESRQSAKAALSRPQPPTRSKSSTRPETRPDANADRFDSGSLPSGEATGGIPRAKSALGEPQFTEPTEMKGSVNEVDPNIRVRFNFVDEEWKDVIEWFAEQTGFGVYFGQTGPPQGTFTYFDSVERDIVEAIDFLNSRLAILQPSHVLVRNGNQLVLVNESMPYPEHLIATVTPDELKDYGQFEVVSCEFDLGKLDQTKSSQLANELREDVNQVHLDGFAYIQAANRLLIRERVRTLERIKAIVDYVKGESDTVAVEQYKAEHVEAEVLLVNLRPLMGFADDATTLEDGSLSFSVQPFGDIIYLKGSPDRIDEFKRTASMIDVKPELADGLPDSPYFQVHRVTGGDPEVIFQVLQTMLDGEPNVKMDQDSNNGNIYLEAPKRIHESVSDFLNNLLGGDSFDIIQLKNLRPSEAVDTVEDLLGIDSFSEDNNGPKLVADKDNDQIFVHGTPQQITEVRRIMERIDAAEIKVTGSRRPARLIPMSPRKAEDMMNLLQTPRIMESLGRRNRLNLILPEERDRFRRSIRLNRLAPDLPSEQPPSGKFDNRDNSQSDYRNQAPSRRKWKVSVNPVAAAGGFYVGTVQTQDDPDAGSVDVKGIGKTTDEQSVSGIEPGYRPSDEPQSVPGAPVEVRMTPEGLMIYSEDLDAGDDLEAFISDWADSDSEFQLPSILFLRYRKVTEAKAVLENILGIESSSGGGGGGGIGGLIGGAVQNAVGGAAGDALGGLLGGGGGGFAGDSEGAIELEGENVRIGTDVRLNALIVTGATDNDIDIITELVDYVDQPGPPQKPQLLGETYVIAIRHRDPMELKEKIQEQLSGYFNQQSGGNAAANQQNAQQQMQQQMMRQIQQTLRGGGKGGGSSNPEAEQPKATLGVDEANRALLITGPRFIFDEVLKLVEKLDVPPNLIRQPMPSGPLSPMALAKQIQMVFGSDKIIIDDEEQENGTGQSTSRPSNSTPGAGLTGRRGQSSSNSQDIRSQIFNAFRNQQGGSRGGAVRGAGGGGRGGGGRGGGGRGGR